jgi:hypothetical protein
MNKELPEFDRSFARIRKPQRRGHLELLIIGSQVRALVRPPPFQGLSSLVTLRERPRFTGRFTVLFPVCTENAIRVDDVTESPKLEE